MYLIVRETRSRKNRYFLASGNAVHAINSRYAGLDHLLGVDTALWVDRLTCIKLKLLCDLFLHTYDNMTQSGYNTPQN